MDDWYFDGLEDDLRPRMVRLVEAGRRFALVTVTAADGGGPRGRGAQMVITDDAMAGFVSGGCIEADIALHAREALADGEPRRLVYGRGSPFVDTQLPCGGRLELLVEILEPNDPALSALLGAFRNRSAGAWISDGRLRRFETMTNSPPVEPLKIFLPPIRLLVVGADAFALALADAGRAQGWQVVVCRPSGPSRPPWPDIDYLTCAPAAAVETIGPDAWTAVAAMSHDTDMDHDCLEAALKSAAGYVGVLGARRRLPERFDRLRAAGVPNSDLERLKAPIGLSIGARSPRDVGLAIAGQIVAELASPR